MLYRINVAPSPALAFIAIVLLIWGIYNAALILISVLKGGSANVWFALLYVALPIAFGITVLTAK